MNRQENANTTGNGELLVTQRTTSYPSEPFNSSPNPDELEKAVLENSFYRKVLYTSKHGDHQQVAMSVDDSIPKEVHADVDQYFLVKKGKGYCIVNGVTTKLRPMSAFWVERGSSHEIQAKPKHTLKLFVSYAPAHHPKGRSDEFNVDLNQKIECKLFG